ncbi:MAG: ketoacyl-ACP synthase III [Actinomycetia bacterium]|nr:ketoacyl-ACP synthase III [Actinomycetes bacterium]
MSAGLVDVEAWLPPHDVPNDIFTGIGLTDEWIVRRSGIVSRAYFADDESPVRAAGDVVRRLVTRCPDPARIGALLVVSTSNDARVPGAAQIIAEDAGLGHTLLTLDLNAACNGFVYALAVGLALVESGTVDEAVVCAMEAMSRLTNMADRQSAFLFGDGVGAVRLAARPGFVASRAVAGSDATFASLMTMDADGLVLRGIEVYKHAITRMKESLAAVVDQTDPAPVVVVPHQANGRILDEVRRGLPGPGLRLVNRIEHMGNTSSASIPLAFAAELDDGAIPRSGRLATVGYGAGEAWGAVSCHYAIDHEAPVGPFPPSAG